MSEEINIELRNLELKDFMDLQNVQDKIYPQLGDMQWQESEVKKLLSIFPEGQLCVTINDVVVAGALAIIIESAKFGDNHTYQEITGNYKFSTHDPNGDVLYGIDIFVHPEYRGMRLARRLYEARKELCENLNLRSIMAGGRISNYHQHSDEITPRQYIEKVRMKEIYDPALTFQLSNDFHVRKILKGYLEGDEESREYATLLEWNNIYYQQEEKLINLPKQTVRLGLVQWQMRTMPNLDVLKEQIEFFVDVVSGYQSDFILFPELFNAPLMEEFNHLGEAAAIRELAQFTTPLREYFSELAVGYNVNIITGSMPWVEEGHLYNISFLCRRDGSYESYKKIHITPNEKKTWGMQGGSDMTAFDTDCGKIGILVCYDVEFPELSRIYADQGVNLLFVPFLTDTQNGYTRVRHCAQARAIENECYIAIAGCVGNLPRVSNMDIQYAQSGVFTPSDFAFPTNAVKAEATPNTEMTLIVDVDMDHLKELHTHGSVNILKDRRKDLYSINRIKK
jgi:predicted amidohydrolase/GNAT superfamily N-acetyltransferase